MGEGRGGGDCLLSFCSDRARPVSLLLSSPSVIFDETPDNPHVTVLPSVKALTREKETFFIALFSKQ